MKLFVVIALLAIMPFTLACGGGLPTSDGGNGTPDPGNPGVLKYSLTECGTTCPVLVSPGLYEVAQGSSPAKLTIVYDSPDAARTSAGKVISDLMDPVSVSMPSWSFPMILPGEAPVHQVNLLFGGDLGTKGDHIVYINSTATTKSGQVYDLSQSFTIRIK